MKTILLAAALTVLGTSSMAAQPGSDPESIYFQTYDACMSSGAIGERRSDATCAERARVARDKALHPRSTNASSGTAQIANNVFACKTLGQTRKIAALYTSGDRTAGNNALALSLAARDCVGFDKGRTVYVEDFSGFLPPQFVKLRLTGSFESYWAPKVALPNDWTP